jgi:hypothetical protein
VAEFGTLYEVRWTGTDLLTQILDSSKPHLWSSATLYTNEMQQKRHKWFDHWLSATPEAGADQILDFHQNAGDGDPTIAINMRRGDLYQTVSITQLIQDTAQNYLTYLDIREATLA